MLKNNFLSGSANIENLDDVAKKHNILLKTINKVYPLTVEDLYSVFVLEVIFASPLGIPAPRVIDKESYISSERSKVYDSSVYWV